MIVVYLTGSKGLKHFRTFALIRCNTELRNGVRAGHTNALAGGWEMERIVLVETIIATERIDCLLDSEWNRCSHEERRFAHCLGRMNSKSIVRIRQMNAEVCRYVVEGRDLICAWAASEELPRANPWVLLVAPDQLLHRAPAKTLNERAFNLSDINRWVDTLPHIHENISTDHVGVASEAVNLNLSAGHAHREVVEREAALSVRLAFLVKVITASISVDSVESMRTEIHAVKVRRAHECVPVSIRHARTHRCQTSIDLLARVQHSHAIQVRAERGC
mmetsp:Transcript_16112/g.32628  ORF Transcript_16112/g.32628 Transcript_16112/m.32628 type:complete len:276 (+) Transcript_16112:94-921(+)